MNNVMSSRLRESLGIKDDSETVTNTANLFAIEGEDHEDVDLPPKEPVKFEVVEVETTVPDLASTDAKTDYVKARNITHTLLQMTGDAVASSLQVAQDTEHPRAYNVFNELVNTMRNLTKDLLDMQKVYKEVTKDRPENITLVQNNTQINQTVNNGTSPNDMLARAEEMRRRAVLELEGFDKDDDDEVIENGGT